MENISLKLTFEDEEIKRQFFIEGTKWKNALEDLKTKNYAKHLVAALEKVHGVRVQELENIISEKIFEEIPSIYNEAKVVPWFLREFTIAVLEDTAGYSEYKLTIKGCKEHLFYLLERKKRKRILRKDNWKLVLSPFFRKAPPPQTSEDEQDIRGFADTLLFLAPVLKEFPLDDNGERLIDFLSWFNIVLDMSLEDRDGKSLGFSVKPRLLDDNRKCIKLPPKYKPVLVASPNVREAIEILSEVWHDKIAKSVLISAWTGSGKEVLVDLLTDAMMIERKQRIDLSGPEIQNFDNFRNIMKRELSGKDKKERRIVFLDEIHHPAAEELLPGLLRLIESDRLRFDGKSFDCKRIFYVFAASERPEELRTKEPRDFWTRIEHTVVIRHPLLVDDREVRIDILKEYFLLFWNLEINRWKQIKGKNIENAVKAMSDGTVIEELSKKFTDELGSPLIRLISIRTVRSIVKRIISNLVIYLRMHPEFITNEQKMIDDISNKMNEWIVNIFNEIVSEIDTRGVF